VYLNQAYPLQRLGTEAAVRELVTLTTVKVRLVAHFSHFDDSKVRLVAHFSDTRSWNVLWCRHLASVVCAGMSPVTCLQSGLSGCCVCGQLVGVPPPL
jgi:hypothetical protein